MMTRKTMNDDEDIFVIDLYRYDHVNSGNYLEKHHSLLHLSEAFWSIA